MSNTQLYLSIGIPTLIALLSWVTVILAWVSTRSDNNRLNDKMDGIANALRTEMGTLGDSLRGDMSKLSDSFRADMNKLADTLRAEMIGFRREIHQDLIVLHERVVKVEMRQDR